MIKKIAVFLMKYQFMKNKFLGGFNYTDFKEIIFSHFSIMIHIVVCWYILGIYNHITIYILTTIIFIYSFIILFFIPSLKNTFYQLTKLFNNEIQKPAI